MKKKIKKNKFGEDESKFISIIDNVYPVFRFMFFFVAVKFFLLLMNFFNSIISAESRYGHLLIYTNIFSVFFVIRCHAAPYIFFFCILFYLILKLWNFSFFFCHCSVPPWFLHRLVALFQMQVRSVSFFRRNHVHTE